MAAMPCRCSGLGKTLCELYNLTLKWRERHATAALFKSLFGSRDIEVLDFASKDLSFNPFQSEIADFVREADAVVALRSYPFLGFSQAGTLAAITFDKPRFLFMPHVADVSLVQNSQPLFVRSLFATDSFPASVLNRFLTNRDGLEHPETWPAVCKS